jgi:hypothetical protein
MAENGANNARPLSHKTDLIIFYGQALRNVHETVRLFNNAHPDRPVSRTYVRQTVQKFVETGSVKNATKSGRPSILSEELQINVLADVVNIPMQSSRTIARTHGICHQTALKILKQNKFHPYKIQLHHALNDDDPDRRVEFCEGLTNWMNNDHELLMKICFSDESTFFLNGALNRHNCRYWSDENPHEFREGNTQYPQKLNVWAGILGDCIIGPFFIEGNLTAEVYLELLRENIVPAIARVVEEGPQFEPIFQQDGAPPHFGRAVRAYLDAQFPQRWIGRRGPKEWPPRSPDLTPLDFFLWGHLKSVVNEPPPENLAVLRTRILNECQKITPQQLRNVRRSFEARLYYCQEVGGSQFEHLI